MEQVKRGFNLKRLKDLDKCLNCKVKLKYGNTSPNSAGDQMCFDCHERSQGRPY